MSALGGSDSAFGRGQRDGSRPCGRARAGHRGYGCVRPQSRLLEELVEGRTGREDVDRARVHLCRRLGSHVPLGAHLFRQLAVVVAAIVFGTWRLGANILEPAVIAALLARKLRHARQAKVGQLGDPGPAHHDVGRLDVSVDARLRLAVVHIRQGAQYVHADAHLLGDAEAVLLPVGLQPRNCTTFGCRMRIIVSISRRNRVFSNSGQSSPDVSSADLSSGAQISSNRCVLTSCLQRHGRAPPAR
eukprot:6398955-Prymnesium_polylepis.3